ncbi:MAG: VOC family protein [Acidimicrobiia bacterium]
MSHRDGYPQGVPSWVDLQAKDQEVAKAFYSQLFGWELDDQPLPMGGHYTMASLDGGAVAGIGSPPPGSPDEMPSVWTTYFAVDDLAEVLAKVEDAGGQVVMPAMQVMESGHMAMVADPTGGVAGLWQANQHRGAGTVNQHGALVWNELITPDPDGAAAFYDAILGTTHETGPMGGDTDYTVINVDGRSVAGAMALPEHEGVPTAWTVYFATDDIDATVARAKELGGTVMNQVDSPAGPLAVIADPQGAVFQVMQPIQMDD